jgi:hypothetical protein
VTRVTWIVLRFAVALSVIAFLASVGAQAETPTVLIGADSIEYAGGDPPNCFGPSILYDYGDPSIRARIKLQLAAMAAAGLQSLRVFFVYDYNTSENQFFVPARSGRLEEPFRSNLVNYLTDIRAAGLTRVTLTFDPRYSADPGHRFGPYDPSTFEASWGLIHDTRPLVKQYGPADTRIDLLNEGAPFLNGPDARIDWVGRMYTRYVDAFGADDVGVSAAWGSSLSGLVQVLRGTGEPLPRWFDVHPRYEYETALDDLHRWDDELTAAGVDQPFVIGEVKYNDADMARALAELATSARHQVEEVMEFPALLSGVGGQPSCINPPYRIDAYQRALLGARTSATLKGTVTNKRSTLIGPNARSVTALESGSYTLSVSDQTRRRRFVLTGPGLTRSTTARFRGRKFWHLVLRPGMYSYGPASYGGAATFEVMTDT